MRKEKNIFYYTKQALTIFIFGLVSLSCVSCSKDDDTGSSSSGNKKTAITFSSGNVEEAQKAPLSRTTTPLETEQTSFVVYTYKHYPEDGDVVLARTVMDGYKVFAKTNAGECIWDYTGYSGQSIHYWDYEADSYVFIAFAPFDQAHQDMRFEGNTIKMPDISTTYTELSTDNVPVVAEGTFSPLFSHPRQIKKEDFGKMVQLSFSHVFCQIRLGFRITTDIASKDKDILINQVSIIPTEGNICNKADINIAYGQDDSGKLTTEMSFTPKAFIAGYDFPDKEVAFTNPSVADDTKMLNRYYHLFPNRFMDGQKKQMEISVHINGEEHKVALPEETTAWEPNKIYTYIFKIDNSLDSKDVIRLYALEIEEWKDGGSAETKDDGTSHPTEDW